jgi:hypothetical protein
LQLFREIAQTKHSEYFGAQLVRSATVGLGLAVAFSRDPENAGADIVVSDVLNEGPAHGQIQ